MARARVYFRFNGSDDYAWQGPYGTGESVMAMANSATDHAERVAFRAARKQIQAWYDERRDAFEGEVEVKIWVDQTVCPQCQLWMIAGVLRSLNALAFKPSLIVEVVTPAGVRTLKVTRDAVWPVGVGQYEGLMELKAKLKSSRERM